MPGTGITLQPKTAYIEVSARSGLRNKTIVAIVGHVLDKSYRDAAVFSGGDGGGNSDRGGAITFTDFADVRGQKSSTDTTSAKANLVTTFSADAPAGIVKLLAGGNVAGKIIGYDRLRLAAIRRPGRGGTGGGQGETR